MNRWRDITELLGLRRNTTLLLVALVFAGTGEKLWMSFVPKYLETLGATVVIIGLFDALQTLLGALYAYPGGWLISRFGWQDGVKLALLVCLALSVVTLIFQWRLKEPALEPDSTRAATPPASRMSLFGVVKSFTPTLRELLVSDILIRFCERIPYAFIILWAMNHAGLSAQQFGVLTAIEMGTAMLCYIPVAHLADKYGQRPFVLATFVFFTLFPMSLLWADNFAWFAVAFLVRGLKEFGEPARKALIFAQAWPELRHRTFGAYYLIRDCTVTTGSFLGAWLWSISPRANFIGAAIIGLGGTLWFWWFLQRSRPAAEGGLQGRGQPDDAFPKPSGVDSLKES